MVEDLVELTEGKRAQKSVKVMGGSGNFGGKPVTVKMAKAVYCTCRDGNVVVSVDAGGDLGARGDQ